MNSKIKVLESNLQQFQAKSAGQSNAINDLKEKKDLLTKGTPFLMQKRTNSMMLSPRWSQNYQKITSGCGQLMQRRAEYRALLKAWKKTFFRLRRSWGKMRAEKRKSRRNWTTWCDKKMEQWPKWASWPMNSLVFRLQLKKKTRRVNWAQLSCSSWKTRPVTDRARFVSWRKTTFTRQLWRASSTAKTSRLKMRYNGWGRSTMLRSPPPPLWRSSWTSSGTNLWLHASCSTTRKRRMRCRWTACLNCNARSSIARNLIPNNADRWRSLREKEPLFYAIWALSSASSRPTTKNWPRRRRKSRATKKRSERAIKPSQV